MFLLAKSWSRRSRSWVSKSAVIACLLTGTAYPAWGLENWVPQAKLLPSTAIANSYFGRRVAISGNTVAVLQGDHDGPATISVFERNGAQWVRQASLCPPAVLWYQGTSWWPDISLSGDTLVFGVPHDGGGAPASGCAYVYHRNQGIWTQEAKLTSPLIQAYASFGAGVSACGDTVAIGAPGEDVDSTLHGGVAYIYSRNDGVWQQQDKVVAPSVQVKDYFGEALCLQGETLLVCATPENRLGFGEIYAHGPDGWSWQARLSVSEHVTDVRVGRACAIDGNNAILGTESGEAYVFHRTGDVWSLGVGLPASGKTAGDAFGREVCLSGDYLAVSAHMASPLAYRSGAAYIFKYDGANWVEEAMLTPSDGDPYGDRSCYDVGIEGGYAIMAAWLDDEIAQTAGAAYIYVPEPGTLSLVAFGACLALRRRRRKEGGGTARRACPSLPMSQGRRVCMALGVLAMLAISLPAVAQSNFRTQEVFNCGPYPWGAAAGDLNGDGRVDIAVSYSSGFAVLYGLADGRLGVPESHTMSNPPFTRLVVNDFDRDSLPDVALSCGFSPGVVSILYGSGFNQRLDVPAGDYPVGLATADFNNDGVLDLATANGDDDNISVYRGQAGGGFAPRVNFPVGDYPYSIAASRLNGDNYADLVVCNYWDNDITVLHNDSSGGFGSRQDYPVGRGPISVVSNDFNRDGRTDVVVANVLDATVSVLYGQATGGLGGRVDHAVGSDPRCVVTGDFNCDGRVDLAVANTASDDVSVLYGRSDGGFDQGGNYAVADSPYCVVTADLDRNGGLDLIVANYRDATVGVLYNTIPEPATLALLALGGLALLRRKRGRMLMRGIICSAAVCVGWAGAAHSAPPQYQWVDLGQGQPYDINNAGQIVGMSFHDGTSWYDNEATLWEDKTRTWLGSFGLLSCAYGINENGQIVGKAITSGNTDRSFLWGDGVMTDLDIGGTSDSKAMAINDAGQIVGSRTYFNAYFLDGNTYSEIDDKEPYDINALGEVAGMTRVGSNAGRRAFLWDNGGAFVELSTLAGTESGARGINDRGQIVGYSRGVDGNDHAVLWENDTIVDLGLLGGTQAVASDINESGQIVGISNTSDGSWHAFLYDQGQMYDLNDLVDAVGYRLEHARAINDHGHIAVSAQEELSGEWRVLLVVPEPATLSLLGLGGLAVLRRRRRK